MADSKALHYKNLVRAENEADAAVSMHYAICPDQREVYGCSECTRLVEARAKARKAVAANPEAQAWSGTPEARAERRESSREVMQYYRDTEGTYGEDY